MSTFVELCQEVAKDSGTISNLGQPATVTGQIGRLSRIVDWTKDAYNDIQRRNENWRWMQSDFTGQTIAGTRNYNAASMSISERFASWVFRDFWDMEKFSLYLTADGPAEEGYLRYVDYEDFRRHYLYGNYSLREGKPTVVSINNADELVFYPKPDDIYTVRGQYRKSEQILTLDADVPEMPSEYHQAIKWRALILLGTYDEAMEQAPIWQKNYLDIIARLVDNQLPRITTGGPLA